MSIKKVFAILTVFSLLTVSVGCTKKEEPPKYDSSVPFISVSSMKIASNSKYELYWDNTDKFVSLKSLITGETWSTIPYEYHLSGNSNAKLLSPLNISVVDTTSLTWSTINGYSESVSLGDVKSERVANGIKVTYFFEKFEISVPLIYTLTDDALKITLDPKEIRENNKFWIASVSFAPYLCSAENDSEGSYIFVPAGTGALLSTDNNISGSTKYSIDIYGEDRSAIQISDLTDDIAAHIPVFGVKNKENALLAIIEDGAESVTIEADAGHSRVGYSGVWATANVRGQDVYSKTSATLIDSTMTRASEAISETPVSVCYYPLTGENADYNGMAKRYRKYLKDNGKLLEVETKTANYGVTIYGGVDVATNVLGIPTNKTKALTTFAEVKGIAEQLKELSSLTPQIKLQGFGENGIDAGRVAGGYKFANVLGNKKDRKLLDDFCKKNNISLYYDFDLIRYNASGNGFYYMFGSAKTATLNAAEFSNLLSPLREETSTKAVRLVKRSKIATAVEKLNKFANKNKITGISLSSLSEYAYSDFNDTKYICKNNTEKDVAEYIKTLRDSKHTISSNSNAYAACLADAVYEVPLTNGNYDAFDKEIPFYQLVFCGSKPMFSAAINLSDNYAKNLMKAVSSGTGINFALIENFTPENIQNQSGKFYAAVFENNIDDISTTLKTYSDFYEKIAGVGIERYEFVAEGVSKTVFENSVTVYANHTAQKVDSPVGVLDEYGVSINLSEN